MDAEQIMIRLGFAADSVEAGVRNLKGKMAETADHIVEHMERPRMATRAFHTAIHEITNISPVAGQALMFAFNPVVAIIGSAVFVLKKLYDGMKETAAEQKEFIKNNKEMAEILGRPVDTERSLREAQRQADRKAGEDRRRAAKEENELNDPLEKAIQNLKRQEEAFDRNGDAIGKLAAQRQMLATIEAQRKEAAVPVDKYNAEQEAASRREMEFLRKRNEDRIKELEKHVEDQRKVQEKNRAAHEEQTKIDEDFASKSGAFPNVNKALSLGDTLRQSQAKQYEQAVKSEEEYKRQIETTADAIRDLDEKLADGKAIHDEEFNRLKKLDQAHKELAASVAATEREIDKQKLEEGKKRIEANAQTALNKVEEDRTAGKLDLVEAAKARTDIRKKQVEDERALEEQVINDRLTAAQKAKNEIKEANRIGEHSFMIPADLQDRYDQLTSSIEEATRAKAKLSDTPLKVVDESEVERAKREMRNLQKEFDLQRSKLLREERRSEIEPYLPTIKELARTPGWSVGLEDWQFKMQSLGPHMLSPAVSRAGEQARELQAREEDLRNTIEMEGPESRRAKEDLSRIKTLKQSLEDAGFIKTDHSEKIKERMDELVAMAKEKGLKIQPVNGD